MAYFEMLKRDAERLGDCRKRVNRLPLGAPALAGNQLPDQAGICGELLGFDGVCGLAGCRVRPRFRHRILRSRSAHHDAACRAYRKS